jgi:hypothetical protein
MNNKNILRLVLPIALSTSIVMISSLSFAADTQTLGGPVKSPLSKTSTETSNTTGETSIVGPAMRPPVTGVTTNKLSPSNTSTTKTLKNNALSQPAQNAATKKTLTPAGVRSTSGPETYIRTLEDRSRAFSLPTGSDEVISKFNRDYSAYKSMASTYEAKFRQCMAKAYTAEDRTQAGCTATTTVASCEEKLLRLCVRSMDRVVRAQRSRIFASFDSVTSIERTLRGQRR